MCYIEYVAGISVRDTNIMTTDRMGNGHDKSYFQNGKYSPVLWNSTSFKNVNNCYAYACNIMVSGAMPIPGYKKYGRDLHSRSELIEAVKLDGLIKIDEDNDWTPEKHVDGTKERPAWLVAMCDSEEDNGYGFHFYRKVWFHNKDIEGCGRNGEYCSWAHKYYRDSVTDILKSGRGKIIDPRDDMEERNLKYIGMYLVSPDTRICTPTP